MELIFGYDSRSAHNPGKKLCHFFAVHASSVPRPLIRQLACSSPSQPSRLTRPNAQTEHFSATKSFLMVVFQLCACNRKCIIRKRTPMPGCPYSGGMDSSATGWPACPTVPPVLHPVPSQLTANCLFSVEESLLARGYSSGILFLQWLTVFICDSKLFYFGIVFCRHASMGLPGWWFN